MFFTIYYQAWKKANVFEEYWLCPTTSIAFCLVFQHFLCFIFKQQKMYSSTPSFSIKLALVKRYLSVSNVHFLFIGYWSFQLINSLFSFPSMPIKENHTRRADLTIYWSLLRQRPAKLLPSSKKSKRYILN